MRKLLAVKGLFTVIICNAIILAGHGLSLPFFSIYLTTEKGVSMSLTSAFLALGMLSTAVSNAFGGEISDALGRKPVMLFSLFSASLMMFIMAAAIHFNADYGWLALLFMMVYFFPSFYWPAAHSWLADKVSNEQRVEAYGLMRIGFNAGWAIGPAIGGLLASISYSLAFLTASITYLTSALIVRYRVDETLTQKQSLQNSLAKTDIKAMLELLRIPRFLKLLVYTVIVSTVLAQLVVGLSLFCANYLKIPQREIGYLFSLNGFVVIFLQYTAGRLARKFRISAVMAFGSLLYGIGYTWVGFSHTFYAVAAGIFVVSVGELFVNPGLNALVANMAPASEKGRYLGMTGLGQKIGMSLGMFLGGTQLDLFAPIWLPLPWCIMGALSLVAAQGFYSLKRDFTDKENGLSLTADGKCCVPKTEVEL